jgi:hypothetical protein
LDADTPPAARVAGQSDQRILPITRLAAPALGASGIPQRPSGPVVPVAPSDNGGYDGGPVNT